MKKQAKTALKFLQITAGAFIYAVGTAFFVNPHDLAPGGVTGIAIILNRAMESFLPIPVGLLVFILNIPLLITGLVKFGKEFLLGTVYGTTMLSALIALLEKLRDFLADNYPVIIEKISVNDVILASIIGGVCMAVGLGVVFRAGATTGGTDIIVKLLRLKYRHIRTGRIFLITDTMIAFASLPVVGWKLETVFYSIVSLLVCGVLLDVVLYGTDGAKLVYIVSDKSSEIAARILSELEIGGTFLDGVGAYTGEKKEVVMCAVKKHLFPKLKDIVTEEDPTAFLIVSSASEIYGEGYKDHFTENM